MKVFIKGLNACAMRRQKIQQYHDFLISNLHEIVASPEESDIILLWTCAFRGDARDNSISEIQKYQKKFDAEMIVGGCLPDIELKLLKKNFSGRIFPWRNDKEKMEEFFGNKKCGFESVSTIFVEEKLCDNTERFRKENPDKDATFHDQFIKLVISEGCNHDCSYCSEKQAFPAYHSFSEEKMIEACKKMVEKTESREVILLADSLGQYGCDTDSDLPTLIRKLSEIHPKLKFALNNLNPADFIIFINEITEFLKEGIIQHINLPIQSASPRILKLMNRSYTRQDIDRIFTLFNEIGFKEFDTHVLVGFPGETEEDFEETLQFIVQYKPKYVLASGFMESVGMAAYRLPEKKVDEKIKRRRLSKFYKQISSAGIICNTDDGKLGRDRIRRLNAN